MRMVISLLLAAMLALGGAAATAETDATVYLSDFTAGTDGWYARSTGTASVSVLEDGALHTEGRTANWHSPGRDFDLIPGGKYDLSVLVRQEDVDAANFMISVAHTLDGAESYENLAFGLVKRGEWTELVGSYTAGGFDRFVLYVETTDAPELAFDIKDFRVEAPEGEPEPVATPEPMVIEAVENLPSLKEAYAGRFDFGSCVSQQMVSSVDMMSFWLGQFNILTPENELKPDSVLDVAASRALAAEDETAVAVHFDAAKPLLDFAQANGVKVHGHVLVWHSQTPESLFHEGYDPAAPLATREVMLGRMENYIRGVFEYMDENYPGVIVSWDVVNEAIDDSTGELRASPWLTAVGEDYLARAFELARKYAPEGTLLYYNDYNTAYQPKQDGIVRVLEQLIAEGSLDGYGFQMHHSLAEPSMDQITASVERVAALGIRLRVSELDVTVGGNDERSFTEQAQKYAAIMRLIDRFADQFEAVQVWGVTDNLSWRASQYPLLFDSHRNPKPAFWAVIDPQRVK